MNEPELQQLALTPEELATTIDALRTTIGTRTYWAITNNHQYRQIPFHLVQDMLFHMTQAYTKAMMLAREIPAMDPQFLSTFMLSPPTWDTITTIGLQTSWDGVPVHNHRSCPVCRELAVL